jgi:DNA-binding LytR/AlgR family response regulator
MSNQDPIAVQAVIADDEPLLLSALQSELHTAWPELEIVATARTGAQAISAVFEHKPQVVFLDITMPEGTGLEVAQTIAEDWPEETEPPLIVFVTAHNEFAIDAFDAAAVDYVLKPANQKRIGVTVARLKQRLDTAPTVDALSDQMNQLLNRLSNDAKPRKTDLLRTIRASIGDSVHMIPVQDVVLLESADKYVIVHTTSSPEALIREPLRTLIQQLDTDRFVQISRGAIVNLDHVRAAKRTETNKLELQLNGCEQTPRVSRMYRHLFQAM